MTEPNHPATEPAQAPAQKPEEEVEGVVQFAYALSEEAGAPLHPDLLAWRELLMRQEMIGQDPLRYDGYSFGNLSARLAATEVGAHATSSAAEGLFIVSASQAAHREHNDPATWTTIDTVNLSRFWVEARGVLPPSSETMTHAMIYAAEPNAQFVFHAHSPEIWQHADELLLPATPADVPYGSPAMSQAVIDLLAANMSRPLVFVTKGHTDGVFALGPTARDTGGLLTSYLARALTIDARNKLAVQSAKQATPPTRSQAEPTETPSP